MKAALSRAAILALAGLAILVAGALLVCPERTCRVPGFDATGLAIAHGSKNPVFDAAFVAVSGLGSLFILVPVLQWQAWRTPARRARTGTAFVASALGGAVLIAHLAKLAIDRPRPELFPALVDMPPDASFPSAHALQITAVVAAWLLRPGQTARGGDVLAGSVLVAAVSLSRVYLQVHFPSDVIAGIATAVAWVLALRSLTMGKKGLQ